MAVTALGTPRPRHLIALTLATLAAPALAASDPGDEDRRGGNRSRSGDNEAPANIASDGWRGIERSATPQPRMADRATWAGSPDRPNRQDVPARPADRGQDWNRGNRDGAGWNGRGLARLLFVARREVFRAGGCS